MAFVDFNFDSRRRKDNELSVEISELFKDLRLQTVANIEYFSNSNKTVYKKFYDSFVTLCDHVNGTESLLHLGEIGIEGGVEYLLTIVYKYDFDPDTPANGYRSLIAVIQRCCLHLLQLSRHVSVNKRSYLFRNAHYCKELEAYVTTLGQLRACLFYIQKLLIYCDEGALFPDESTLSHEDYQIAKGLMKEFETLSQDTFYGRCLGFHYCKSMKLPLSAISLVMASFSNGCQWNYTIMNVLVTLLNSGKFYMDPEARARQIVKVTRSGDIRFCKAFWSLAENYIMHNLPLLVCPMVKVDQVISIEPKEFLLDRKSGIGPVMIAPPFDNKGPVPVRARLMSYVLRDGQEIWLNRAGKPVPANRAEKSRSLIVHIHGGGFVAQSSASHEVYLRQWAKDTDIPIFCIDYSLAPEAPFPQPFDECFFAYCWALRNASLLGSTGEFVCVTGDSAGGNLAVALTMKASVFGIQLPNGIVSTYGCMVVRYLASASRLLSLMDPLLPLGLLSQVLAAYAGLPSSPMKEQEPPVTIEEHHKGDKEHSSASEEFATTIKERHDRIEEHLNNDIELCSTDSITSSQPEYSSRVEIISETCGSESENPLLLATNVGDSDPLQIGAEKISAFSVLQPLLSATGIRDSDSLEIGTEKISGFSVLQPLLSATTVKDSDSLEIGTEAISGLNSSVIETESQLNAEKIPSLQPMQHLVPDSSKIPKSSSTPCFSKPSGFKRVYSEVRSFSSSGKSSSSIHSSNLSYAKLSHFEQSPVDIFQDHDISKNPYMSPYFADAELLRGLCPVYLVACHLDPMLDDSVMFAKKLRAVGTKVHLDVLDGLPHGFLNFVLVSSEASKGSQLCVKRIRDVLRLALENSTEIAARENVATWQQTDSMNSENLPAKLLLENEV